VSNLNAKRDGEGREMTNRERRAVETLKTRISVLEARLERITPDYSFYHELRKELADYKTLLEMVTRQQ
jgi:hypothetical protein